MASSTHASTWTATRDDAARQADETDPTTGTATATEIHTYGDEGKTRSVSPASQPPYVPQFSAATALILDRIKAGTKGGFNSALSDASASTPRPDRDAYEDARSRLVRSMVSSNTAEDGKASSDAAAATLSNRITAEEVVKEEKPVIKRKREEDCDFGMEDKKQEAAVDFTQNTMIMPPPRPRPPPKKPMHRHPNPDVHRLEKIERARQRHLESLPATPAKPELVGFRPGAASDAARTEYFYAMKKTDVLNVLSFCDQLKPQLLVDIMVSVSKRHPDLPMFNSPDWEVAASASASITEQQKKRQQQKLLHRRRSPLGSRSRHGHSLLNSKARQNRGRVTTTRRPMNIATKKNKVKSPLKRSHLAHEVDKGQENEDEGEDDEEEEEDEEVDVLPETWPRPGEGMYAKIAPETDDGSLLADANDEEAFSQFFVNKMGRQMVDPV